MIIGISAITFLIAFAFGVERIVTKEVTGGNAFELIDVGTGNSQIIKLNDDTINRIREIGNVNNVETTSNLAAVVKGAEDKRIDASLFATTPKYMTWSSVEAKWGSTLEEPSSNEENSANILISTNLLDSLEIGEPADALGKTLTLDVVAPKELTGTEKKTIENQNFTIAGVIKNDSPLLYTHSNKAKQYELSNYSQAKAEIKNPQDVEKIRMQIENLGLKTQYVGETVQQVEQVFMFFKIILGSFGLIAMIVASLAMFNTLTISLLERTREVALLKILGMKNKDISRLFLTEAVAMGLIGGILGIVVGIVISNVANSLFNHFAVNSGGDPIHVFFFPLWFIIAVFIFALIVGFLTGLYPARRAMRVHALDVMRYE